MIAAVDVAADLVAAVGVALEPVAAVDTADEPVPGEQEHATKAIAGTRVPVRVARVDGVSVALFEWERL